MITLADYLKQQFENDTFYSLWENNKRHELKESKKPYKKYSYTGPIYYNGIKISNSSNMFTMAVSRARAIQNFIHKAANGDIRANYDIIDELVSEVSNPDDDTSDFEIDLDPPTCDQCGHLLSDNGTCPYCDEGEEEMLEI